MRYLYLTKPFNRVALVMSVHDRRVIELFDLTGSWPGKLVPPNVRTLNYLDTRRMIEAPEIVIPDNGDADLVSHEWEIASDVVKELWPFFRQRFQDQPE